MIQGIGLENFKAFQECAYMDFKKINVFLGPNSSGKSSYLKGLLALQDTMKSPEPVPAIHLTDRIGSFKNIVYGQKQEGKVTFSVTFGDKDGADSTFDLKRLRNTFGNPRSKYFGGLMFSLLVVHDHVFLKSQDLKEGKTLAKEVAGKYAIAFENYFKNRIQKVIFSVIQPSPKKPNVISDMKLILQNRDVYDVVLKGDAYEISYNNHLLEHATEWLIPYKFFFKLTERSVDIINASKKDLCHFVAMSLALFELQDSMSEFCDSMLHMEPFRKVPERSEMIANFTFGSVGPKGENMLTNLINLFSAEEDKDKKKAEIRDEINQWMKEFHLAESIDIEDNGNNYYSLVIENKHTKIRTNIVDVGVGTSQLLPIILESVISEPNSNLLIEEPETHIHPNAQAKLGELFASCSMKHQKRFFIETHSLYLVRQFQILVAKKELKPEDIGIYYFEQDENGTHIKDLRLSENGQFEEEFPKGFFDVPFQLTKELMNFM